MTYPRVTINLPVYNGGESLQRQLEAITSQTFTDFRVLITDNASTDDTESICREYEKRDSRFIYRRNSRNRGLNYSATLGYYEGTLSDFTVYTSHSDYWAPQYLDKCVSALDEHPEAVLAYSHCVFFDPATKAKFLYKDDFDLAGKTPAERFITLIGELGMCTPFYGLIRGRCFADHMHCITSTQSAGPDNLLLAALAYDGPFIQIPEPLFFRENPQYGGETMAERYSRINRMSGVSDRGFDLPLVKHIIAHQTLIMVMDDLDFKAKNDLMYEAIATLIMRYRDNIKSDIAMAVERIKSGSIYSGFQRESAVKVGQHKIYDLFMCEQYLFTVLYQASVFFYNEPELHYAMALLHLTMNQRPEALCQLEIELGHNPTHRLSLELLAQLKAVLGRK